MTWPYPSPPGPKLGVRSRPQVRAAEGWAGRDPQGGIVVSELVIRDAAGRKIPLRNATVSTSPSRPGSPFNQGAATDGRTFGGGWVLPAADRLAGYGKTGHEGHPALARMPPELAKAKIEGGMRRARGWRRCR
jgi:hypothetical protein